MSRSLFAITAFLAFFALASPCRADDSKANQIAIENFTFTPPSLTVPAGATVTWTNHDDIPHLVVIPDFKQRSAALDTDQSFSYTFSQPGTYTYFCGMHPKMTGTVVVTAAKK